MNEDLKKLREAIAEQRDLIKKAFLPMPGDMPQQMAPGGQPPMDPAMAAQAGGMPPGAMPPGAMPPGAPMDPAMAGGQPPMDPAAQGGMPPGAQPDMMQVVDQVVQGLEELFSIVQQLGQAVEQVGAKLTQQEEKIGVIVDELSQPAPMPDGMGMPPGGAMPAAPADPAAMGMPMA